MGQVRLRDQNGNTLRVLEVEAVPYPDDGSTSGWVRQSQYADGWIVTLVTDTERDDDE